MYMYSNSKCIIRIYARMPTSTVVPLTFVAQPVVAGRRRNQDVAHVDGAGNCLGGNAWRAAAHNRSKQGQRFLESDIPSGVRALRCTWQISPTMLSNCPANSVQRIGRATPRLLCRDLRQMLGYFKSCQGLTVTSCRHAKCRATQAMLSMTCN